MFKTQYIAIGNEELRNQPEVGETVICPNCKEEHKVEYGKDTETGEIAKTIGFVNCKKNGKSYLVAVDQKLIFCL